MSKRKKPHTGSAAPSIAKPSARVPLKLITLTLILSGCLVWLGLQAKQWQTHQSPLEQQYFTNLHQLYLDTKDPELAKVEQYIRHNRSLVHIRATEVGANGDTSFEYLDPDVPELILSANLRLSPITQAIIFAHGARHARSLLDQHPEWSSRDSRTHFSDERDTWNFCFKLAMQLSGGRGRIYHQIVVADAKRMRDEYRSLGAQLGDLLPSRSPYNPALSQVFGPPASKSDELFRKSLVYVNAMFMVIEQTEPANKREDMKALFLRAYYDSSNA